MEKQASAALGEQVVAGALVSSAGTGKAMGLRSFGAQLGGAIGSGIAQAAGGPPKVTSPGGYQGVMYMAVGPTKVGFFGTKQGLIGRSLKDLLLTVSRGSITTFEMHGGALTCPLAVALDDGTVFALEVPRAEKGKTEKIGALLTGR